MPFTALSAGRRAVGSRPGPFPPESAWEELYHIAKAAATAMGFHHHLDLLFPRHGNQPKNLWYEYGDAKCYQHHRKKLEAVQSFVENNFRMWDIHINNKGQREEFKLDKCSNQVLLARRALAGHSRPGLGG